MPFRYSRGSGFGGRGQLDTTVLLQTKTDDKDAKGATIEVWPDPPAGEELWASVLPQSSREFQTLLKQHEELAVVFKIGFRAIDPATSRIAWRESSEFDYRFFDIAPPMVVGLQEGLLIPGIEIK